MPITFGNGTSTITGKPEPSMEEKVFLGKAIFNQIKSSLFPDTPVTFDRNPERYINPNHPAYQPSLFAEPGPPNMMVIGQSGAWRAPLTKYMKFISAKPGASVKEIIKKTKLTRYQVETIKKLLESQ